jgi:hypothetical protein
MTKDYLGRDLNIGDNVIFIRPNHREFKLGQIAEFTVTGRVEVKWGDESWQNILQQGTELVRVEGTDLTMFFLNQKEN